LLTRQYPAIALPYLKANEEEDRKFIRSDVSYIPPCKWPLLNDEDSTNVPESDTPDVMEGMPCGFQIMGRPMRDEELLQVAGIVHACVLSEG
jgi:amidase